MTALLTPAEVADPDTSGTIYVVQANPGTPVKIGFSAYDDLTLRLKGLQTGNPHRLRVIAHVRGTMGQERAIHAALAPERLTGEWFEFQGRTIAFVERLGLHGLEAALQAIENIAKPDVPPGWDKLIVSETGAHRVLDIQLTDTLSKARKSGTGPAYLEVQQKSNRKRYYRLGDLHRWLTAKGVPFRKIDREWHRYVIDLPPSAQDHGSAT